MRKNIKKVEKILYFYINAIKKRYELLPACANTHTFCVTVKNIL